MIKSNNSIRREQIKAEIERLGLDVIQHGNAWRVCGTGVDILVCDLADLDPMSLRPARWAERGQSGAC